MQYVPFGQHGFQVSRLGMGMMRLPTREEDGKKVIDREAAIALVRHGVDPMWTRLMAIITAKAKL